MTMRFSSLQWGISTLGCPEYSLPEAVRLADSFNMKFLELRSISGSNKIFETLYRPENIGCARQLSESGRCRVIDSSFHLALFSETERAELVKIARAADDFNIPYIRIFGHFPIIQELTDEVLQICSDNLNWFQSCRFNARLALETHDTFLEMRKIAALVKKYGAQIPVIWDAHNTLRFTGEELEKTFEFLRGNIVTVHFKDSHFEGAEKKYTGDIPGEGEMPLEQLFELLERNSVDCPVIFEYEKFWQPSLPPFEQALNAWKNIISK